MKNNEINAKIFGEAWADKQDAFESGLVRVAQEVATSQQNLTKSLLWRTDLENCPKDKEFLVMSNKLNFKIVKYTPLDRSLKNDDPNQEFGYAYGFDYENQHYHTVEDFEYWMEIPDLPANTKQTML